MIFKGTRTSFASWRPKFFRAIESIWDVGGATEAESLEELISSLEKDIDEWSNLRQLDLTPLIEAELERLSEQMQRNYLETSQETEAISQEMKSLDVREVEVTEAMVVSSEHLMLQKIRSRRRRR